jgi:hypothetical protein
MPESRRVDVRLRHAGRCIVTHEGKCECKVAGAGERIPAFRVSRRPDSGRRRVARASRRLQPFRSASRAPVSAVQDRQVLAPRSDRVAVLLRHHAGGLFDVPEVVHHPRGQ